MEGVIFQRKSSSEKKEKSKNMHGVLYMFLDLF